MSEIKLKRCPCCNSDDVSLLARFGYEIYKYVKCQNCGLKTKEYNTEEEAAESWNQRKVIDEIVEQLEEIKNTPPDLEYRHLTLEHAIEIVKAGAM